MIRQSAFTLLEVIVVVVLVGILASGAGMLIARPAEIYQDQTRRQALVDSAEMSLRRIADDIRRALPNSLRIVDNGPNSWALELVNTVDGARYRDDVGAGFTLPGHILDFTSTDQQFNLLGRFTTLPTTGLPQSYGGYRVVIYNTDPSMIYTDAALNNDPGIVSPAGITLDIDGGALEHNLTLSAPFRFAFQSPGQRMFLIDGPVSYLCDTSTGNLTRLSGYSYQQNHSATDQLSDAAFATAQVGVISSRVSSCQIDYQAGTTERGALVSLQLGLTNASGDSVVLLHQVHVDNLP